MLNKCVFIGRLIRDPELRYTANGTAVTNFSLAVERPFTNSEGKRDVDYIKIVVWRKLAESCARHLNKGRLVAVTGRLQIRRNNNTKDNKDNYINPEIVANTVKFLDWPDDDKKGYEKRDNNSKDNFETADFNSSDHENIDVPF